MVSKCILHVVLLGGTLHEADASKKKLPHLVFVLVDDMGHNDFYSSSDLSTAWPNVAKLAKEECIKVEQYYTQPLCTPTRGAFMAGRMPIRLGLQHGVISGYQDYGLPLDEQTLAQKLSSVGYSTVGVGKWHLGIYNKASMPRSRGFDHWFGYMNGAEDYLTHEVGGYLDLYNDDEVDTSRSGIYSAELFGMEVVNRIHDHKTSHPDKPLFLYFPIQNVHAPLESPSAYSASAACRDIPNADRKTFCGMAKAADDAIGNMTTALETAFPEEDVIIVISGDNGGMPASAGNQCPSSNSADCLRGHKAELWEGGIRNNALLCSRTLVPAERKGQTYSKGLVHVMDWHATFRSLGGASDLANKPLDGMDMWDAITKDQDSPRTEFLVNIDPCGTPACSGSASAYHFVGCAGGPTDKKNCGHFKLIDGILRNDSWYALPTSVQGVDASVSMASPGPNGDVMFPPSPAANATYLFNISADPGERVDLASSMPQVVKALQAKVAALASQSDIKSACNIPSGSCYSDDPNAATTIAAANAWVPWVSHAEEFVV